jgi:hypothetical protein
VGIDSERKTCGRRDCTKNLHGLWSH